MRLGLPSFGDVGEGLDEAAVRELSAANLDDGAVRHQPLADRQLTGAGARIHAFHGLQAERKLDVAPLAALGLKLDQAVVAWRVPDEVSRQVQELAASSVDDRDMQILCDQHDSLVDALERALELIRFLSRPRLDPQNPLQRGQQDQRQRGAGRDIDPKRSPRALEDRVLVRDDAHPERIALDLADGDRERLATDGIDVLEGGIRPGLHVCEQPRAGQVLAEREAGGRPAAGTHEAVITDQRDRRRRSEIDLVVELGEMLRIERGDHDTGEAAVGVEEATGELHRTLAAGAPDERLADEQQIPPAADMDLEVLPVAQIRRRSRLRPDIGGALDAVGVDDRDLDDGLAEHIRRVDDGAEVGRVLAGLDAAPQIEQRLVDLADGAEDVLLEDHREVMVGPFGVATIGLNVLGIFQRNAGPQHGDDQHAEDRRATALRQEFRQLTDMKIDRHAARPILTGANLFVLRCFRLNFELHYRFA